MVELYFPENTVLITGYGFDMLYAGPDTLQIEIFRGDHTVWCFKCGRIVMMRDCPHDKEDYLLLSGTNVREMLAKGEELPKEFARPEVAEILSAFYRSQGES